MVWDDCWEGSRYGGFYVSYFLFLISYSSALFRFIVCLTGLAKQRKKKADLSKRSGGDKVDMEMEAKNDP